MKCVSRFAAVGWSDGGIVALLAAIAHPGVVTKVKRIALSNWLSNVKLGKSKEKVIWLHESNIRKGKDMMTFQAQDGNKIENSIFYKIKVVAAAANYTIRPEDADGEPFSFTNICRARVKTLNFVLYIFRIPCVVRSQRAAWLVSINTGARVDEMFSMDIAWDVDKYVCQRSPSYHWHCVIFFSSAWGKHGKVSMERTCWKSSGMGG